MKINSKAPKINLTDKDGESHSFETIKGDYLVVYFYPKDDTPGCTVESIAFSEALSKLKKLKATVVGISGGDDKSKTKFCKKHDLEVLLLSDTDFSVAKAFGAYGEKSFMGRKFKGIFRNTYILDKDRKVIKIFEKVKPETHVDEVLEFLASVKKQKKS
jgi:peroxiredoxin Q/BCP